MLRNRMKLTAVALGVLVLAGCADDEPRPDDSGTPSQSSVDRPSSPSASSASPTPTPTVPELPEAATTGDAAGAEAFVTHWFDLANFAIATGDTMPLRAASDPTCEVCDQLTSDVHEIYDGGGHVVDNLLMATEAISPPPDPDGLVLATVTYSQASGTEVRGDGGVTEVEGRPELTAGAVVGFKNGEWIFVGLGEL